MTSELQEYQLYGGAITTKMTKGWLDASNVRSIPDHQEVFIHTHEEVSLIVELLDGEMPIERFSNTQRILMHFEDLRSANESLTDQTTVLDIKDLNNNNDINFMTYIPFQIPRMAMIGKQFISKFRGNSESEENRAKDIIIILLLVRLANVNSDLLLSMSLPLSLCEECNIEISDLTVDNILLNPLFSNISNNNRLFSVFESLRSFANNLAIRDWNLFSTS